MSSKTGPLRLVPHRTPQHPNNYHVQWPAPSSEYRLFRVCLTDVTLHEPKQGQSIHGYTLVAVTGNSTIGHKHAEHGLSFVVGCRHVSRKDGPGLKFFLAFGEKTLPLSETSCRHIENMMGRSVTLTCAFNNDGDTRHASLTLTDNDDTHNGHVHETFSSHDVLPASVMDDEKGIKTKGLYIGPPPTPHDDFALPAFPMHLAGNVTIHAKTKSGSVRTYSYDESDAAVQRSLQGGRFTYATVEPSKNMPVLKLMFPPPPIPFDTSDSSVPQHPRQLTAKTSVRTMSDTEAGRSSRRDETPQQIIVQCGGGRDSSPPHNMTANAIGGVLVVVLLVLVIVVALRTQNGPQTQFPHSPVAVAGGTRNRFM